MRIFTTVAFLLFSGCTGDLVEIGANAAKRDLSGSLMPDLAQHGGGEMGPSAKFFPDIQMDLDSKTAPACSAGACHGTNGNGSVMYVKPQATAQADIDANYMRVMNEVNTTSPAQSPLLTNPVAGSMVMHTGGKLFPSTSDPTYVKWLAWIQAGAPKQ